mmetsp:Transcript_39858/g.85017  ORF Transcript_39858/g.85017 Transcript_39858/m.85017 type:complete len:216 (-) Transcript_39858:400-1047(-)
MANVPEPEKANWPQDLVDHVNLETPRFLLRQYEEGDAAAMLDFWETSMQPLMQWCAHALPWKDSPSETREQKLAACSKLIMWFHANTQQRKRWIPLAVIDKSTKALVGEVGTFTKDSLAATTFGYMTRADKAGTGIATEATRHFISWAFTPQAAGGLGVGRLSVGCHRDNLPSRRIPEKLGLRRIGPEDHGYDKDDPYCWSVAAGEWDVQAHAMR